MKTRDAVLTYQETLTDTQTKTLDLDGLDPISALDLEVECTNGATSNLGNYLSDILSKVEVVDGSDVLASLNGSQLQALQFYKTGKPPAMFYSEVGGGTQRCGGCLLFGRWLWDTQFALVPSAYKNPQLKITFNKAAVNAVGATGFASGNNIKLTVVAKLLEEGAAPVAFLMQKELESFTAAASGDKRIVLPTDYPYRMLMLRAHELGSDIDEVISDIKLTLDSDKYIPLNRKVKQLDREAQERWGEILWQHNIQASNEDTRRTVLNKEPRVNLINSTDDTARIGSVTWAWSSQFAVQWYTHAGVAVTDDESIWTTQHGHALHATLPISFGLYMEPDTWFDAPRYGKFEAVLTQANADGVCQVVAEQVRPR